MVSEWLLISLIFLTFVIIIALIFLMFSVAHGVQELDPGYGIVLMNFVHNTILGGK